MKKVLVFLAGMFSISMAYAAVPIPVYVPPSVVASSQPAVANAVATVTITTPTSVGPYSAGNYTYVTKIYVVAHATATITGTSSPVSCTTAGITNTPKLFLPTALTVGQEYTVDVDFKNPLQATIGTNVVISCPASGSLLYSMFVTYFQGS